MTTVRARRWAKTAAVVAVAAAALSGCGIPATSVPVDAGSAPSRASCEVHGQGAKGSPRPGLATATVYLVCTSQLMPLTRSTAMPSGSTAHDPVQVARALLDEVRRPPSAAEGNAGFSTEVPDDLAVSGPRKGDPAKALRLSEQPDELPPFALAQLVCTYAGTDAAGGDPAVLLGGPQDVRPLRYECTDQLRSHAESVQEGLPIGS
jgi:hypothetical protein